MKGDKETQRTLVTREKHSMWGENHFISSFQDWTDTLKIFIWLPFEKNNKMIDSFFVTIKMQMSMKELAEKNILLANLKQYA